MTISWYFFFLRFYLFILERGQGQRERERENPQTPRLAQSPTRSLIPGP